ncbi:S41 family peptidase [Luteimonas deserti]|uniref:S41 family peptidase n=1 Tax=Luteimonas deserti TaxID=2752306 RepID=A0A7Z0QRG9_9GAMM|nr:S41 family peptidase [Luteimonas deserti]NYZ63491.1 S41 family peptidase [Luteimonas deserti]
MELTLKLARERAYRAADVDWSTVEAEARLRAAEKGEDDAIRFVLKSLGDGHSFYRPPRPAVTALPAAGSASQAPVRNVSEAQASHEGVPVIRINGWSGTHQDAMAATAALRSDLVSALSEPRCGIVLDFSGNTGGNMWPMLIGLSPLLNEGVLGYFKDARGTATVIDKRPAGISIGGSAHALNTATAQQPRHPAPLVAIAVGPRSSSSGEIVPIMFHGQTNVRLFGQPTSGHSTANSTFALPNGGAVNITTAVTLDRHGRVFDAHIEPDVSTERPVEEAARWVSRRCRRG